MTAEWRCLGALLILSTDASAQWYSPPAGIRPARIAPGVSILPGGRVIAPRGEQHLTGAEPMAVALSASGKTLVVVNRDPARPSLTVLEHDKTWAARQLRAAPSKPGEDFAGDAADERWRNVSGGVAFSGEHSVFVAEGNTGRIALIDLETGERRRAIGLDDNPGNYTGDLALDAARNILYIADLGHSRVVALDTRSRQTAASISLEGAPLMFALAPDQRKLYVITAHNLAAGRGKPGRSVCVVDVAQPHSPRVEAVIRADGWASHTLAGIFATGDRVFISDLDDDSVTVIDARSNQVDRRIPIRIPGLQGLRGVHPVGLAYDEETGWLLVAEAGMNAVGVLDPRSGQVVGHIPSGWFPTRVLADHGNVYVMNEKGVGTGPDLRGSSRPSGSVSIFAVPDAAQLSAESEFVLQAAGLVARPGSPPPLPSAIRHVVMIVKEGRSFDELLGDIGHAANASVMGVVPLARFGRDGYVDGGRQRLSLHHLNLTPNHHAIAARWSFSDNFYASAETGPDGMHWLSPWTHLARHGVSFYRFGKPFDPQIADVDRVRRLIEQIDGKFARPGGELPQFVMIHLPNDRMAPPRPHAGYPYPASYLADNDLALGRILEYLSGTPWWNQMAVFVTEASAERGIDHVDAHRTVLLCAGPWARRNSVSHTNADFSGLLKTVFRLLGVPPSSLFEVSASDLSDCFTNQPDPSPYRAAPVDPRVYGR